MLRGKYDMMTYDLSQIRFSARNLLNRVSLVWSLEPFVWTVEPTKEELSVKLSTATRGMDHMNSLLHETEATNAVLMEQITVRISTPIDEQRRLSFWFHSSDTISN